MQAPDLEEKASRPPIKEGGAAQEGQKKDGQLGVSAHKRAVQAPQMMPADLAVFARTPYLPPNNKLLDGRPDNSGRSIEAQAIEPL